MERKNQQLLPHFLPAPLSPLRGRKSGGGISENVAVGTGTDHSVFSIGLLAFIALKIWGFRTP